MKKSKSLPRILSVLAFIGALVSFFCNFAAAFVDDNGRSGRGNLFTAIFALEGGDSRNVVVPLIIGIVLIFLLIVASFTGIIMGNKGHKIIGLTELVLGVAVGVLFLFALTFYGVANPDIVNTPTFTCEKLGAGPICVAVFAFFSAFLGLLTILLGKKEIAVE